MGINVLYIYIIYNIYIYVLYMYNMYYIHKKMTLFSKWSIFCPFSKPSTVQSEINTILLWLYREILREINRMINTAIDACMYKHIYADTYIDR